MCFNPNKAHWVCGGSLFECKWWCLCNSGACSAMPSIPPVSSCQLTLVRSPQTLPLILIQCTALQIISDSSKYLKIQVIYKDLGRPSELCVGFISCTPSLHQSSSAPLFIQFRDRRRPRAVIFCALRNSKLLMQLRSCNSSSLLGTTEMFHLK